MLFNRLNGKCQINEKYPIGREKCFLARLDRQCVSVLLFVGCMLLATEKGHSQTIDGATIILSPSWQYFFSDRQGGGEFALNLAPNDTLFQMQSEGQIVLTGLLTSFVVTGSELTADTSGNDGLASGEFSSQSTAGVTATLTMEAKLLAPISIITPIVLLVAEAAGPAVAAEVIGSEDNMQIQVPMRVTGGELLNGILTGLTASDFTATYAFDSFGVINPHINDFAADIFFVQGPSLVQFGDLAQPIGMGPEDFRSLARQWLRNWLDYDVAPLGGDFQVNLADWAVISQEPMDTTTIQMFVSEWLDRGATLQDSAPNGGDGQFNLLDFAAMSQQWLDPNKN